MKNARLRWEGRARRHLGGKPHLCLTPKALAFPPSIRRPPHYKSVGSKCLRKGGEGLTISPPAPCAPWLVQTAGSPESPLCQSASCRRTGEKRAGCPHPVWTKHIAGAEMVGCGRALPAGGDGTGSTWAERFLSRANRVAGHRAQGPADAGGGAQEMGGQPGSNQLLGKVSQPWACAPHRHERKRPLRHGLAYKAHGAHFVWHRGVKGARAPMVVSEVTLLLGPFLCLAAMARNQMRGPSSLAGEVQGTVRLTGPGHQATTLLPK